MRLRVLNLSLLVLVIFNSPIAASVPGVQLLGGFDISAFLIRTNEMLLLSVFGSVALLIANFLKAGLRLRQSSDSQDVELRDYVDKMAHGKPETANNSRVPQYILAKEGADPSI